jgi:DNA primase
MTETRNYIDFAEIKRRISLSQCATMLGLQLKQSGNQMRCACPVHGGGERTLVVTPDKGFYCFNDKKGGDQVALVAHVKQISNRDAAEAICLHFALDLLKEPKETTRPTKAAEPPAPARMPKGFDPEAYARRLDPAHEKLADLGVSAETFKFFGAGHSNGGVNRGRLAIPLHDRNGGFVCYFGRALGNESPALVFPNGTDTTHIFNAHRVKEGELYLVRDPLAAMQAYETGIENVVAFLSPVTAQMLEQLASLMDERRCDAVELY